MSNVPIIQFKSTGLVLPAESEILSGAFTDIDEALGGGSNQSLKTPQGQLAASLAKIIADKNEQIALITNQMNPDYSSGIFQDGIGRIYFLERKPATHTSVTCQCVGAVGTVIPAGTMAQDTSGNYYNTTASATIPSGGTVDVLFQAVESGPIACPPGAVTTIYQTISGWDSVTNSAAGIPGVNVESRAEFEARRRASVFINAHGTVQSIYSNVFNVPDVTDCYVTENYTGSAVLVGASSFSVVAHSVYVAVSGGTNDDVAKAIWEKKDIGCNMNGNTTVTVYDTTYDEPYPATTITFQRPSSLSIKFAVSLVNRTTLPSNIVSLVRAAIVSAFSGGDEGERAKIGGTIYASRFYSPVSAVHSSVSIVSILVGTSTANSNSVIAGIDQAPTVQESDITVTLV